MKTKKFIVVFCLLAFTTYSAFAQKTKKNVATQSNTNKQSVIKNGNDSLSYAYGYSIIEQGIKQFLTQLGIEGNQEKIQSFLNGLNESLPAKGANSDYIAGLSVGDQIYKMSLELDKKRNSGEGDDALNIELLINGLNDAILSNTPRIDSSSVIVEKVMTEVDRKEQAKKDEEAKGQIELAKKFMDDNKTKEGVVSDPSGIQYIVMTEGTGEKPASNDKVKVHYKGQLTDGTVFDSSYDRGEPLTLGLNQVIKGWAEAIQLMPVGSKWKIFIPYELGYGSNGAGGQIPPYANLIFEVELLNIEK